MLFTIHDSALFYLHVETVEEAHSSSDVVGHDHVFVHKRHAFAVCLHNALYIGRRLQRTAEVNALSSIHKLYGRNVLEVGDDFMELGGCIRTHRHKILLPVGAYDAVA